MTSKSSNVSDPLLPRLSNEAAASTDVVRGHEERTRQAQEGPCIQRVSRKLKELLLMYQCVEY